MKLTKSGFVVLVSVPALLVAGRFADYPELVIMGYAAFAALLLAAGYVLMRPSLSVSREIRPDRASVDQLAYSVITVENCGRRRAWSSLVTEEVQGEQRNFTISGLKPGQRYELRDSLRTNRRGIYQIGPLRLGRNDPLGLIWVGTRDQTQSTFRVYPQLHSVAPTLLGQNPETEAPVSSGVRPPGAAFYSLRDYLPGDDWRLIHWKSTARLGTLMVRHEVLPIEPSLVIVLDTNIAAYTEQSFEHAVSAVGSLSVATVRAGFALEFRTTDGLVFVFNNELTGPEELNRLLDRLAEIQRNVNGSLTMLPRLIPAEPATSLIVVTGQPPDDVTILSTVRSRFQVVSLICFGKDSSQQCPTLSGVVTMNVNTCKEFAAVWNRLVRS